MTLADTVENEFNPNDTYELKIGEGLFGKVKKIMVGTKLKNEAHYIMA